MNSGYSAPTDEAADDREIVVSSDTLDRIVVSLTVVHGRVQLLRHHMRHHGMPGNDDLEAALDSMEVASRAMAAELWTMLGTVPGASEDRNRR